jgi:glyoxylase-like metal-dependent hydrolase (beta-lactamase superfamily II)
MHTIAPGIRLLALRTPTLPPATHTNTWVVGDGRLSVFDPASPWEDEQQRLLASLQQCRAQGETVERLVLTHHHHDHVAGAMALRAQLGGQVPIVAHPETARLLNGLVDVDDHWQDLEVRDCGGRCLIAHHTPGHAPGHLVFLDRDSGAMIAGDMVAGVGTIAISPQDGNLGQYLASLQHMIDLEPTVLLPAHGDALHHPHALLSFYIAHRNGRTEQFRKILTVRGRATALEIATEVYQGQIPPDFYGVAAHQVTSHLIWLREHGVARQTETGWQLAG